MRKSIISTFLAIGSTKKAPTKSASLSGTVEDTSQINSLISKDAPECTDDDGNPITCCWDAAGSTTPCSSSWSHPECYDSNGKMYPCSFS